MGQVLDVLLDNALRHGGGDVGVRARPAVGGLVIEVDDHGPGIADDRLAAVFDRHEGSGNGIGLALARTITEAEGGRLIAATGRPPCFHVILPAAGS
jgi:signal transduction histidine kinase